MSDSIFHKNYQSYLEQLTEIDLNEIPERLGVRVCTNEIMVPLFGQPYKVSNTGILNPVNKKPAYSICIVLCKYLLLCPDYDPTQNDWTAFKDFKDAAPLVTSFSNTTERVITEAFSGKCDTLEFACKSLGAHPAEMRLSYDLSMKLYPLPKVPVLLLFNDRDDEFPADCKILFEKRAAHYLDMECLAILGTILAEYLKKAAFKPSVDSDNSADGVLGRS